MSVKSLAKSRAGELGLRVHALQDGRVAVVAGTIFGDGTKPDILVDGEERDVFVASSWALILEALDAGRIRARGGP